MPSIRQGTRLGPYEIVSRLGAGGMGEVWQARDTRLDRSVAVKVLPPELASDAQLRLRFEREAKAISQLSHPNICRLYDVGEDYLVMELLDGETLADRIERGALPLNAVLQYGAEIADALHCAHRAGIVHRDLKPGNVMVTKNGTRLLDFGLAKTAAPAAISADVTVARPMTQKGTLIGTFQYMAPEQLQARDADERSDIFALGTILYEMATGRRAFAADSQASLIASILTSEPRAVTDVQPSLPRSLDHVIRTCLAKDPEARYQSARDVAHELRWIAEAPATADSAPPERPSRRRFVAAIAAAIVVTAAAVGFAPRLFRSVRFGPPTIVLIDSTHPLRVYDEQTRKDGGTNADDLTDLLHDLPVTLVKENTTWSWHREDEVLRQSPDLVVIHRSCFYVPSGVELPRDPQPRSDPFPNQFEREYYDRAADKFEVVLGYLANGNPRTKFIVYSRRSWKDEGERLAFVASLEKRFPQLKGRVTTYSVPLDRATFRNPQTGAEMKKLVVATLGLT